MAIIFNGVDQTPYFNGPVGEVWANEIKRWPNGRRPVTFDFSRIDEDVFTETLENGIINHYTVTRGTNGEIVNITDQNGLSLDIDWPEEYVEDSFLIGIAIGRSMKGVTVVEYPVGISAHGEASVETDIHHGMVEHTLSVDANIESIPNVYGVPSVETEILGTTKTVSAEVSKTVDVPEIHATATVEYEVETEVLTVSKTVDTTVDVPEIHATATVEYEVETEVLTVSKTVDTTVDVPEIHATATVEYEVEVINQ